MSTLTFERPSCHDAFSHVFGSRRGIGVVHLDASAPSRVERDEAQRILGRGLSHTFEALHEHRRDLALDRSPLLSQMLDEAVEILCAEELKEQEGMLRDFFCSTVRDGRSDRILRVQLDTVAHPHPTPFRLHLWPDGGPDRSCHDHSKKVLTACGQDEGEMGNFQHAPIGAWAGEDNSSKRTYERCPKCATYAAEHPLEFPELTRKLHDILPATDLALLLSEHRRLVRERILDRLTKGRLALSDTWARKVTEITLRNVMVSCAINYLLSDGPGNVRFSKMSTHYHVIAGKVQDAGYEGRLVDVLSFDEWHEVLYCRRPPKAPRRRTSTSIFSNAAPKPTPTLQGDWERRRTKLSDALWHIFVSYGRELSSGKYTKMHQLELAGGKGKPRKGRRRGRAALPGGRLAA